jgi:hypothetical protein
VPGNVAIDITGGATAGQFVWTNVGAQQPESITNYQDGYTAGSAGTKATFTVNFNGTDAVKNGDFTFDGQTVSYIAHDGPISLAQKTAAKSYVNWDAVDNLDGTVTFTAKAEKAWDNPTTAIDEFSNLITDKVFGDIDTVGETKGTFTLEFTGTTDNAGSLFWFDKEYNFAATWDADTQADNFADLFNANKPTQLANWTAAQGSLTDTDKVIFTQDTGADFGTDALDALLAGIKNANPVGTLSVASADVAAVNGFARATLTFTGNADTDGGTFTILGENVTVAANATATQIAHQVSQVLTVKGVFAAGGALENWHAVNVTTSGTSGVLTIEYDTVGFTGSAPAATITQPTPLDVGNTGLWDVPSLVGGSLINGVTETKESGIEVTVTGPGPGNTPLDGTNPTAASGTGSQVTGFGDLNERGDYLDFSSYDVSAVVLGSVSKQVLSRVSSTHENAASTKYVQIDTTALAGVYNFTLYDAGSDGIGQNDQVVDIIGTVDFGRVISWNWNGQSYITDYEGIAGNFIL